MTISRPDRPAPDEEVRKHSTHNFLVLAAYHIVVRMGWIFKTESIIMPAVMDALGGTGWQRGCLPMLNRFGQSVPPLWFAPRVRSVARKKWVLFGCTILFAATFLVLALMLWLTQGRSAPDQLSWTRFTFLALYGGFFCSLGINQLTFHALQGKLIRVNRRGRLMLVSNVIGAVAAILCVWWLMPRWLSGAESRFDLLFGFAGLCFGVSALLTLFLIEPRDHFPYRREALKTRIVSLVRPLRDDRNFRRLAMIAVTFGASFVLFPHYQALARERLQLDIQNAALWVIVQNAGTALFSMVGGPLADWRGNRLVLNVLILGVFLAPVVALGFTYVGDWGGYCFPLVFVLVGMTPVTLRSLNNYTLEIASRADQPHYLAALGVCVALPSYFSPLMGWILDMVGFEVAFLTVSVVVSLGWLLTWRLEEPRHDAAVDTISVTVSGDE